MTYPATALSATPSNHGEVAADVRALGRHGYQVFNVRTYGLATGDGTTDDTTAFNNTSVDANAAGGVVFVPPGDYSVNDWAMKAGVIYIGIRGKSIIRIRTGASYLASYDSGGASTYSAPMRFSGLTFRGRVDTDTTPDAQRHLLRFAGASDLTVEDCDFIGWHGDAIYLAGVDLATLTTERHNRRVTLRNTLFDGLTKNNRNCVSIIDGEDIEVLNNYATRFSSTITGTPGFVDVEPNAGSSAFAIARRIRVVGNHTWDHHANVFQLNLQASSYTNEPQDFLIEGNIDNAGAGNSQTRLFYAAYARSSLNTDTSARQNLIVRNNICRTAYQPWEVEGGIIGLDIHDNTFEDCAGSAITGYWNNTSRVLRVGRNSFVRCAQTDGSVIRLIYVQDATIDWNHFQNCGPTAGGGVLVNFSIGDASAGASDKVDYMNNKISGTRTGTIATKHASHTLTASANNLRRPYRENGLTIPTTIFGTLV